MKRITKEDLRAGNACPDQFALFEQLYPEGVSVCRYCAQEAQKKGLLVAWLTNFLSYGNTYKFISAHSRVKQLKKPIRIEINGVPLEICSTIWVDAKGLIRLERAFLKKPRMIEPKCTRRQGPHPS